MAFDDRNVRWFPLGEFKHFLVAMCDVDVGRRVVDFLIKFESNQQIVLHRHLAQTSTLVVQGEHRLYEPNGSLKEIRAVGSYTASAPGTPHREGGGSEECVVFYSIRAQEDGAMFELLNDDMTVMTTLGLQDFLGVYREQRASPVTLRSLTLRRDQRDLGRRCFAGDAAVTHVARRTPLTSRSWPS